VSVQSLAGDAGRVRSLFDFYVTRGRTQIQSEFQYRVATYFWLIGMLAEPIVYLVVWTTIAKQQGGEVQGITTGHFAAYYIVWTLVRNMTSSSPRTAGSGGSGRASCPQRCSVQFIRCTTTWRRSRGGSRS